VRGRILRPAWVRRHAPGRPQLTWLVPTGSRLNPCRRREGPSAPRTRLDNVRTVPAECTGPTGSPEKSKPLRLARDHPAVLAWSQGELLGQSFVPEVNEGAAFAWRPERYKHSEALIRMEPIWRAWEHLRLEPALGISTWWLNHADPHMRVLMDKENPFKNGPTTATSHRVPLVSLRSRTRNPRQEPLTDSTDGRAPWRAGER
jgi:hypothetical protein